MKPDKRITVPFRCELTLLIYLFIYLFCHANSAKKMVLFRQHSRLVENHHFHAYSQAASVVFIFKLNLLMCTNIHVCVDCL